jgi:hypothetical protein
VIPVVGAAWRIEPLDPSMRTEEVERAANFPVSSRCNGFAEKTDTIADTTDVAGNFAKFTVYCRCLGEAFGRLETWS